MKLMIASLNSCMTFDKVAIMFSRFFFSILSSGNHHNNKAKNKLLGWNKVLHNAVEEIICEMKQLSEIWWFRLLRVV